MGTAEREESRIRESKEEEEVNRERAVFMSKCDRGVTDLGM